MFCVKITAIVDVKTESREKKFNSNREDCGLKLNVRPKASKLRGDYMCRKSQTVNTY